ncbi:MAG: helix-turn-helix transcriptional regulator [Methyloceanibacter sp.]
MKLLSPDDLEKRGIRYSRSQRNRLIKAGKFPRPIRFSENGPPAWTDTDIDNYIAGLVAKRDAEAA